MCLTAVAGPQATCKVKIPGVCRTTVAMNEYFFRVCTFLVHNDSPTTKSYVIINEGELRHTRALISHVVGGGSWAETEAVQRGRDSHHIGQRTAWNPHRSPLPPCWSSALGKWFTILVLVSRLTG